MADVSVDLYCNFKRCRTSVTSLCWITSCSHVLCNDHSRIDDGVNKKCPVCNTILDRQFDFLQVNVNPSEEYKSMVLAGLSPGVVFDIASRALTFWNFQQHIERTNQSMRINHLTTRVAQLQVSYETMATKVKNDFQMESLKKETLQNENQMLKTKLQEANKCIFDKNRQLQSLQLRCDEMRRETVTTKAREEEIMQSQREHSSFTPFIYQDHIRNEPIPMATPHFQRNRMAENALQRVRHHGSVRADFKFNPVTPSRVRH